MADQITFFFEKVQGLQTLPVDGVYSSVGPSGEAFFAFFTERFPIPFESIHTVSPDGKLGGLVETRSKKGVVREIHTALRLSREAMEMLKSNIDNVLSNMNHNPNSL